MMPNMMNRPTGVPVAAYTALSEVILRFADAVESLITGDLRQPFSRIPSEAVRDRAADGEHLGTRTKTALTNLAMNQSYSAAAQCDLLRGIAAALPAEKVFFSPYPLARTCAVTAAKAWFIVSGPTREERLQRYLNEELGAIYGAAWDFNDSDSLADIAALTDGYVAVGATAGLRSLRKNNPNNWDAPYLVRSDQGRRDTPPSETTIVREMFTASGFGADQAGKPYALLSAATHGRFTQSGVSESILTGRTEFGVQMRAFHSSAETSAKVTVLAAIAARTHLRALARYANEPQELVDDRLGGPLAEWCAAGEVEVPD
ncbi:MULTISPECIES: hypothetical protein [Mycolicibacterium]|uniref:Uncharacterized protein n=1 Tax=Mycolicibacterium senegalense TaxID=1796 RepID=A0A378SZI7_9MYCO|nr:MULTISPECIES: hypothetical protein [Mycolicibacterium]MCV7335361.1 hypothetical protein [Mycolicibacterium senegalense]MDR7290685.1 hypothetical protein [Mycolicibacterium senegalense]QZA22255.1 hypothetical protein K3U95_15895 [Mycolicibacterium senegalense]CDP89240.1 hypothetical protein BN975_05091 [Mycolicibacterium farcinogenes]STZ53962.1 Uncharacterised protein [Mycolicibacterium senegalense]